MSSFKTFYNEHIDELLVRVLATSIITFLFIVIGYYLGDFFNYLIGKFASAATIIDDTVIEITKSSFTENSLWGGFSGLIIFHYLFVWQIYLFVLPGLYKDEIQSAKILLKWVFLTPVFALILVLLFVLFNGLFEIVGHLSTAIIRTWYLKFYLISTISTFLFQWPRSKQKLNIIYFIIISLLILGSPNHLNNTFIIGHSELMVFSIPIIITSRHLIKKYLKKIKN